MISLNLPSYKINVAERGGRRMIYDFLRRRYVALTPEEWVRQHFVHLLTDHLGYPQSLMANEVKLAVGNKTLRADSVLYHSNLAPRMIIEYKAPHIKITQKVFDQITVYNMLLHVDYLIISNGLQHYCCKMDYENKKYLFLKDIPTYDKL